MERTFTQEDRDAEREAIAIGVMAREAKLSYVGTKRASRHLGKGKMKHGRSSRQVITYNIFGD